jgi:hypothetical protein
VKYDRNKRVPSARCRNADKRATAQISCQTRWALNFSVGLYLVAWTRACNSYRMTGVNGLAPLIYDSIFPLPCTHASSTTGLRFPSLPVLTRLRWCIPDAAKLGARALSSQLCGVLRTWNERTSSSDSTHSKSGFEKFAARSRRIRRVYGEKVRL